MPGSGERPHRPVLGLLVLAAVSCAVRMARWARVFTPDGVRFVADSDTHYHVLRARQVLDGSFSRFDPGINFPVGAKVLWPPLLDLVLAFPASLGLDLERSAAVLPVVFGVATVLTCYWVSSLFLSRSAAFVAALLFSLSPGSLGFTLLGRPDQHLLEGLLVLVAFGAFVAGRPILLGVAIALSFASWQGSGLYLVVLGTFLALWYVLRDGHGARTAALGCGAGAIFLAIALGIVCPPALVDLGGAGVTGFHVLLMGGTALFAGALAAAEKRAPALPRASRALVLLVAAAIPALVLAVLGRSGLATNLIAAGTANRWYLNIGEWQPLFTGDLLRDLLIVGGCGLVAPLAFVAVVRLKGDPFRIAFLATWGALFVVATVARQRLGLYLAAPAAIWAAAGLEALGARLRSRWVVAVGVAVLSAPSYLIVTSPLAVKGVEQLLPALAWLRSSPVVPGREAILADWDLGTVARYYSGRPVLTNPAGTDGGVGAMEDAARFYLARDEWEASAALRARRVGHVLVQNPLGDAYVSGAYREPDCVRLASHTAALVTYAPGDAFWGLPLARLYFSDGRENGRGAALAHFRLLFETNPESMGPPPLGMYKLFGVVPGAVVRVRGTPGSTVTASVQLSTNVGRELPWTTAATVDGAGSAVLHLPYATGANGFVGASAYQIATADGTYTLRVSEAQVTGGDTVALR